MITITHLSGFGRGKSKTFDGPSILLGTDPSCDIRFDPAWDKEVSPRHAQISILNGECIIDDLGSSTGVWISGKKITREALRGTVEVSLGQSGQRLQVQVGALPAAAAPAARQTPPSIPQSAAKSGSSKAVPIAIGIAALLTVGFFTFKQRVSVGSNSVTVNLGQPAAEASEAKKTPAEPAPAPQPAAATPSTPAASSQDTDTRMINAAKGYEKAIGLVVRAKEGVSDPCGTAWAVGEDLFATNAHVAIPVIRTLKAGGSAFVVINKNPELRFRVRAAIPHPRYFESPVNLDGKTPAADPFDVAILLVEGKCPVVMKLAQKGKLESLDSGHRVAFLGFPMENLINGGVDMHLPVATMQSGIITSVTDFWLSKAPYESRTLVQHNLPATGGASGSPIFDADGEVVSILSAGNITFTVSTNTWASMVNDIEKAKQTVIAKAKEKIVEPGMTDKKKATLIEQVEATINALNEYPLPVMNLQRAPSAAQINFAQRIDMLQELLDGVIKARSEGKL